MSTSRRVFLSHTSEFARYPERYSYVQAAKDACNRDGFVPGDMSLWSAADNPAADECRQRIADADVYVGVIGFSYGSPVRDEPAHSYTELEYEEARARGIPTLVFLLADDGDMPLGLARGNPKYTDRQEAFRQRLREDGPVIRTFKNPDELDNVIGQSLRRLPPPTGLRPVARKRAIPFMARQIPANRVDRPALAEICSRLQTIVDRRDDDPPASGPGVAALAGPPGFGKTVLADWSAHQLRSAFPDGVLRIELGQEPTDQELISWLADLSLVFESECPAFATPVFASRHLAEVLSHRRVLLIVDDLWRKADLAPFLQLGPSTVLLITTRNPQVLPDGIEPVVVKAFREGTTRLVLSHGFDEPEMDWADLAARTGGWPLLAGLVNGVLQAEVKAGAPLVAAAEELARTLATGGPAALDTANQGELDRAITATVELSLNRLQQAHGDIAAGRFIQLAIFPEGVDIPLELLAVWWKQSLLDVRALARTLLGMSLIESYHAGAATIRVHDVLRDYAIRSARAPQAWGATHAAFLAAHRPPGGWAALPDEAEYLWRWVPLHLSRADDRLDLTRTVCDAKFLARKTHMVGLPAVLDDLALLEDPLAVDRLAWFRRWSHLLRRLSGPVDLAATLMARPDAAKYLNHTSPELTAPSIRYAPGWGCPESGDRSLERVLGTHRFRVQTCAWSADGQRLASTGGDGVLRVWEIDGRTAPTVPDTDGWIVTVAWAPHGTQLAFGDDDGAVYIWAPSGADAPIRLGRHARGVRVLAWSPDGRHLASGSDDGVRVWNRASGSEVGALTSQAGWVRALAWSPPTGEQLACAFDNGAVVLWDPGSSTRSPRELGRHPGGTFAVCWSANGTRLTTAGRDGVVRMWLVDRRTDVVRRAEIGGSIHAVAWSADDRRLACGADDGTLRLWTVNGRGKFSSLGRHRGGVSSVTWQPYGDLLASGGFDGDIRLWRVNPTADDSPGGSGGDPVRSVAWSPDGRLLAGGTRLGVVTLWPAAGGPGLVVGPDHDGVQALAWSQDGQSLAVGGDGELIRVHSTVGGPTTTVSAPGGSTRALAWSPASIPSLACVGGDGTVQIWRFDGGPAMTVGRGGESSRAIAWSPDGRLLAIGDDGGRLTLWDVGIDARPRRLGRHPAGVLTVCWDPRRTRLVTGHADGAIRWWSTDSGPQRPDPGWQMDGIQDLAWVTDGSRLVGVGVDGMMQAWTAPHAVDQEDPERAIAVDGSLFEVTAHPNDARVAVAGSHGVYVMDLTGPGRTEASRTAPTPRSSRTPPGREKTTSRPLIDPFFDRAEESARIDEAVELLDGPERRMVVFEVSGIGGIGKTRFLRQTMDRLATRSRRPAAMVWVALDDEASTTSVGPLTSIRGQLTFDCPLFDTAMMRYWAGMDRAGLPDPPADSSSAIALARQILTNTGPVPLPADFGRQVFGSLKPTAARLLGYRPGEFTLIDDQRAEPDRLYQRLPELLGLDIARRMRNPDMRRVVVCYDGYDRQSAATIADHAPWLRQLLLTVDAGVHLIASRERLGWEGSQFGDRLRSIELRGLPEAECRRMIRRDLGDLDREVEDRLIEASGNVAFNVRALIHVCREEMHRRGHVRIDRLPATPPAVVDHFLDHLPGPNRTLAQMLAAVQYFDESLFDHIARDVGPSTDTVAMTDFIDWFFVAEVGGGVYKTHDLLTTAVRQAGRADRSTSDTLRRAARHLTFRTREIPQVGAERAPQLFRALVEGWQAMENVPPADTERLIDIGHHLYDSGHWRGLKQLPGQSDASEQPAKVVARYLAALSTRRIDGPVRGLELLNQLQPLRPLLGRHSSSFDIEWAYLREIRGDYAFARREFRRLSDEAVPFDPTRRDHLRARLNHADMLIMDGAFGEANQLLAEAYDLLEGGLLLDRAELMRHRGHAYRFSLQFSAAESCYERALLEAQESPSMSAKLRTNLAESRCWHIPDVAADDARSAIELNGRLDSKIEIAKAQAALGVALARTAVPDVDRARSACDLALTLSEKVSYPAGSCFALQALVVVDLAAGSPGSAERADAELQQRLGHLGTYGHLSVLPAWLRADGDDFRARAHHFRDVPVTSLLARLALIGPGPADIDDHLGRPGHRPVPEDGG